MEDFFTLSRDNFNEKCPNVFKELWLDVDLSDVTLATEDSGQITAHKVILAASSPFFKKLLTKNLNTTHPLLYLMGVKKTELQQLLSYIYLGKCDLTQEQLPAFMATGKQLEIEGLHGDLEETKEYHSQSVVEGVSGDFEERKESFSVKRNEVLEMSANRIFEAKQETNRVQREYDDFQVTDAGEISSENPNLNESILSSEIVAFEDSSKAFKCNKCDYQTYKGSHLRQHKQNVHEGLKYNCTSCEYKSGDKSNLKRHFEKDHLGVLYTCQVCKQVFNHRFRLKHHVDFRHNGVTFDCEKCHYRTASKEEGILGCIVNKKVRFSSPNLVMGFVIHQIW